MNFEKGVGKSVFLGKTDFKIYKEKYLPLWPILWVLLL